MFTCAPALGLADDRQLGPGAQVDPVAVAQRHSLAAGDLAAVDRVPLADPGSTTDQVPSGALISTACSRDTPGSAGGPARSISGSMPLCALRRPTRTSVPDEPEPALRAVGREADGVGVRAACGLDALVVARSAVTTAAQAPGSRRLVARGRERDHDRGRGRGRGSRTRTPRRTARPWGRRSAGRPRGWHRRRSSCRTRRSSRSRPTRDRTGRSASPGGAGAAAAGGGGKRRPQSTRVGYSD